MAKKKKKKNLPAMHGMHESWVSPLGWEDALPCPVGGGHGNPLKYSHLENPMDEKAIVLTIRTFVSKVVSLLYTMLSRFDMGFLGGSLVKNSPARVYLWLILVHV